MPDIGQLVGTPNQRVCCTPLQPIPALGNQYVITVMYAATQYPEAIPLRKIMASVVVRALIKKNSTCGLPKILQSD